MEKKERRVGEDSRKGRGLLDPERNAVGPRLK